MVLIVILPFDEGGNGAVGQLITQLLLLVCVIIWAIASIRQRRFTVRYHPLDLLVLAGFVWIGISLIHSEYAYATLAESIKLLSYAALWAVSRIVVAHPGMRSFFLWAMLGSGLVQAGFAFYMTLVRQIPGWRAGFVNPNNLAAFLVIGMHLALSALLFRNAEKPSAAVRSQRWCSLVLSAVIGVSGFLLVAIRSRGALLSFILVAVVLVTIRQKYAGLLVIGLLALAMVLPFPQGSLIQRLSKRDDPFAYQRFDIWKSSLRMIADYPMTGVGLGMFSYYGPVYNFPVEHQIARYGKRLDMAHNDFLRIAAELGLPGLGLFAGAMVSLGVLSFRRFRTSPRSWVLAAVSAALAGLLLHGLVSNLLVSPALAMMGVLLASILLELTGKYRQKSWDLEASAYHTTAAYGVLALGVLYLLVPVIGYPFLGHRHFRLYQHDRRAGQLATAVTHLHKAIDYVPLQAYYHHALGQLYTTAFRNQPTLDAFYEGYVALTQAIHHNSRDPQFYMTLASLHRSMYRYMLPTRPTAENALQEYGRALEVDPFSPFIRAEMATLSADLGEFDQAVDLMQEAVRHEPNFVRGYQLLAKFYRHLKREADAQEALARAETIQQTYPSYDHESQYTRALLQPLE